MDLLLGIHRLVLFDFYMIDLMIIFNKTGIIIISL